MPTRVRLFVSGGPDQELARELLGRALAELPINIGWMIKRTPDIESVAETHLFMLLLGQDISAPVGLELWWARRTEKPMLAYRSQGMRTPACNVFLQDNADLEWTTYDGLPALKVAALRDLARFLTAGAERYGLTVPEAEALRAYLQRLGRAESVKVPTEAGRIGEGTDRGGGCRGRRRDPGPRKR
jgi:hypothetical protein